MPYSSRKTRPLLQRGTLEKPHAQAAHLEERFDHLAAQFRAAQLQFQAACTQHRAMQQECLWLQKVVCTKQRVIEELLPYYPHPLTPELLYAIELY